jgi:glutathione S-transferase
MELYDLELSGNCNKVRLFLSLIGRSYDLVPVDFLAGAHKKPPLSDMNPFGEIPVLVDGDLTLRDSQAILVYLARKHGGEAWLPTEAGAMAQVVEWLMVAENEVEQPPGFGERGCTTSLATSSITPPRSPNPGGCSTSSKLG